MTGANHDPVGATEWRQCSEFAIGKQARQLLLVREVQLPVDLVLEFFEIDPVGGRQDGKQIAALVFQQHSLRELVFPDEGRVSGFFAVARMRVLQRFVTHAVGVEVPLDRLRNRHGVLLSGGPS